MMNADQNVVETNPQPAIETPLDPAPADVAPADVAPADVAPADVAPAVTAGTSEPAMSLGAMEGVAPAVPEVVQPVVETVAPAAETIAETSHIAEAAVAEVASTERPRVQLAPTIDPHLAKPVPTYQSSTPILAVPTPGPAAVEGSPEMAEADSLRQSALTMSPTSGPAEIPGKQTPLSADLEAEIAAAMAGAMQATSPATKGAEQQATMVDAVPLTEDQLEPGTRLKAKVQQITADDVFCDVGFRSPGTVPLRQFPQGKQPRIGEEFLVHVDKYDADAGVIQLSLPKATRKIRGGWEELSVGQVVDCTVNKTNKGGLEVTVSNLRAFLPASQIDLGFIAALETYVGQKLTVEVTEVNPAKRNLVVSRKAVLIRERKEASQNFWPQVDVGQQYLGTVKSIKDYGVFIDLGGVDGFLHIGEMSWTRIKHPADLLTEGQKIDVVILSLDREKQKIGLGMRQLAQNPWANIEDRYHVGKTVTGKVTRVTDFGAFLELETGVEGLVHISELDYKRVKKVGDVLSVGQEVPVQVLEIVPDRQRISLSLKALKEKPEVPKDEDLAPGKGQAYERKRKDPLRGGTGASGPSSLFGNPIDFQ